jgi:hypothetical protein
LQYKARTRWARFWISVAFARRYQPSIACFSSHVSKKAFVSMTFKKKSDQNNLKAIGTSCSHHPDCSRASVPMLHTVIGCMLAGLAVGEPIEAQGQQFPPPSRTVFKCESDGRIHYSDSPCAAAKKLDIEPTRGVSNLSGKERIGSDVRQEKARQDLAEALRPLTGMDAKQTEVFGRRLKLTEAARRDCAFRDRAIPQSEAEERAATKEVLEIIQTRLLTQRRRFRELEC